ncbi:MAG: hypothetical protein KJO11_04325, partial [Gemmatimonadetes bacterium]|nr:hypothetical protein [Gemmatimonadota bacterium]
PPTAVDGPSAISSAQYITPGDGNESGAFPGVAEEELFEVCKRWVGTSGVAIFDVDDMSGTIFTTSTDDGTWTTGVSSGGFSDWSCRDVYLGLDAGATVRVTERSIPGYTVSTAASLAGGTNAPAPILGPDYVEGLAAGFVSVNNDGGSGVTAYFTNTEIPQGGCTLTIGYWKTHSEYGPAPYDSNWANLPAGADTPFFLSGQSYYEVFQTPVKGNQYYNLAHQWMGAYLNVLNGASIPADVLTAWNEAQVLFETYTPGDIDGLRGKDPLRADFVRLAGILGSYNEGDIGPGHCD